MKLNKRVLSSLLITLCLILSSCFYLNNSKDVTISSIPPYSGSPFVIINNNEPSYKSDDFTTQSFESYSKLDELGRCGVAFANLCTDTMPTEKRGYIGNVKPSAWQVVKYDFINGKYLYNRCHLIGYQLSAENSNEKNLITGTRHLNINGMLPFENTVADYIIESKNHVLYRVTPVFEDDNLLVDGVQIEAKSVEDDGKGICFNVFCYNVQSGVTIDYKSGYSYLANEITSSNSPKPSYKEYTFILNNNTYKFHYPSCPSVSEIRDSNIETFAGSREQLIALGYEPCGKCKP